MRKLATAAFAFCGAIFAAHYILPYSWLTIVSGGAAALSLTGLLFKKRLRARIFVVFLAVAAGLLWSWSFTVIFVAPAGNLHDQTATVTAVVSDFPVPRARGYHVDVRVRQEGYPDVGARLRYFRTIDLQPGDIIEFTARFSRVDGTDESSRIDGLTARGAFLSALLQGDVEVVGTVARWRHFPQRFSQSVADIIARMYPSDVSPFVQAITVGRRAELNLDVGINAALTASGITHVVSVSGLHVIFLMGFLAVFIDRRRRLFAVIGLPVLFLFMAITGFNPPVIRAGIMQAFWICAPIFRRESDSVTSVSAALMVLFILNPYSAGSAGLQFSFAATLGMIVITPKINAAFYDAMRKSPFFKEPGLRTKVARVAVSSLATTIGATLLTIPLEAVYFGRVSLISPITNLLTLWAVSLSFTLGVVSVLLGFAALPLGGLAAYPVTIAVRYITDVARAMAAIPFSSVYTSNPLFVFWFIYVYVMFLALPAIKARLRQYLYPACLAAIMLCAVMLVTPFTSAASITSGNAVTVLDVGQGQSVVLTSGSATAMIDCGSLSGERAGSIAHEFLTSQGRTTVDLLIITHFHSDHVNGLEYLFSRTNVSALAVPDPDEVELSHVAHDIIDFARRRGTDIIYVTETLMVSLGNALIIMYPPIGEGGDNETGLSVLYYSADLRALITGDKNQTSERTLLRHAYLPYVDVLVIGHHGSRHSTSHELLYAVRPAIGIISVGRNTFGHPSQEVLERLEHHNVTVFRTDMEGSITVSGLPAKEQ